jgi:hypothetical protein
LDARASISIAEIENAQFRPGEIDGTDDIPKMARTDNVWSQCAIYGVSGLIVDLVEAGQEVETVDLYFDPKSLKPHRPSNRSSGVSERDPNYSERTPSKAQNHECRSSCANLCRSESTLGQAEGSRKDCDNQFEETKAPHLTGGIGEDQGSSTSEMGQG